LRAPEPQQLLDALQLSRTRTDRIERWDVVIVGAGTAGRVAAMHFAHGNKRLLVLEAR
jgi:ribulose 1,5-bisphosphate synthetase/thiazole synthase